MFAARGCAGPGGVRGGSTQDQRIRRQGPITPRGPGGERLVAVVRVHNVATVAQLEMTNVQCKCNVVRVFFFLCFFRD